MRRTPGSIRLAMIGSVAMFIIASPMHAQQADEDALSAEPDSLSAQHGGLKNPQDRHVARNAARLLKEGREIFRYETFGDEVFWGDTLQLHRFIAGSRFGGVGAGLSPKMALELGLKVDVEALPKRVDCGAQG